MPRFKATIRYLGTAYHGFQMQPDRLSIQEVLQDKIQSLIRENISVIPSGRTDAGVHALAQVVHFDAETSEALLRLRKSDFVYKINCVLPSDINVIAFEETDASFHARKSARQKTYSYLILRSKSHNPFLQNMVWPIAVELNLSAMRKAADAVLGKHDFSAFCASDSTAENKIKNLLSVDFFENPPTHFWHDNTESWLCLEFTGDGFLKQMVRNLVGTLVEVGRGKIAVQDMQNILDSKDRTRAAMTAPACGLYLKQVSYS